MVRTSPVNHSVLRRMSVPLTRRMKSAFDCVSHNAILAETVPTKAVSLVAFLQQKRFKRGGALWPLVALS